MPPSSNQARMLASRARGAGSNPAGGMKARICLILLLFFSALLNFYLLFQNEEKTRLIEILNNSLHEMKENLTRLEESNSKIRLLYNMLLSHMKNKTLKRPSWKELKIFLERDDTNNLTYKKGEFDCSGFALELCKRALLHGFNCAFVEVNFANDSGHALNAFRLNTGELVYVDVTGNENGTGEDKIAYVEVGKPYGLIPAKNVRNEIINCTGISPSELWKVELTLVNFSDLFSYEYYEFYQKCSELYSTSTRLYNEEVARFNEGKSSLSYEQMERWYENLKELEAMLGKLYERGKIVESVEIYWMGG